MSVVITAASGAVTAAAGGAVSAVTGSAFDAIVESAARAAASLAGEALAAFAAPSTRLDQPSVLGARSALRPLLLGILTAAVLVQALRLVLMRRGEPLAVVATGLARFVLATTLGLVMLQAAMVSGDALAAALPGSPAGDVGSLIASRLTDRDGLTEPFLLLLASVCVLLLAAALWMALVVRQIALLVIAATLPLAAAGSLTVTSRGWLARLTPWAVALILYKPAAALVLGLGASYLGSPDAPQGVGGVLGGIVVLGLAVAVLPATMRLLSWTGVRVAGGLPAAARTSGPPASGAVRLTGRVGGSAVAMAGFLDRSGPTAAPVRSPRQPNPPPLPPTTVPARAGALDRRRLPRMPIPDLPTPRSEVTR